jgi:oxygen-independent coproporphyrinogen-3 oxidase
MLEEPAIEHLYVHVPFCAKKCAYCAFYSEAAGGELVNRYVEALVREMEDWWRRICIPRTIFFGGGTPSLLTSAAMGTGHPANHPAPRLAWARRNGPSSAIRPPSPWTRPSCCANGGVNRVSMGAQSFDEALLDRLGRVHSRLMIFKSFDILRAAGFDNLNVDLMFAIPGQTPGLLAADAGRGRGAGQRASLLLRSHLRGGHAAFRATAGRRRRQADEDLACAMYDQLLQSAAADGGFQQYEVANFARHTRRGPGGSARAGPAGTMSTAGAAGSFTGLAPAPPAMSTGVRTRNWSNTTKYCEELERGRRAIESSEELPPLARAGELAAFGLRMNAGWPLEQFQRRTGFDLRQEWKPEIERMIELGYGELNPQRFHLTSKGLRFADWAGAEFLRS